MRPAASLTRGFAGWRRGVLRLQRGHGGGGGTCGAAEEPGANLQGELAIRSYHITEAVPPLVIHVGRLSFKSE